MAIDFLGFTPFSSTGGGILIGAGAVLLVISKGRIAGIGGIIGSLLQKTNSTPKDHYLWRLIFIAGLMLATPIYSLFQTPKEIQIESSTLLLLLAGLLVGFGVRMGSGCTSGHAVCGLGRLSVRSLIATFVFMSSAFITSYFLLHL